MDFKLLQTSWNDKQQALSYIRSEVFIREQQVPAELEWDDEDQNCIHILATDIDDQPVATARMKPDGHIGRMAVLRAFRNQGIGSAILNKLTDIAKQQKINKLYLHAQTSAINFYAQHGFAICSNEFMDAGIPHRTMEKILPY
ncbi:MAG: GNAT family N-acetyltransferase [Gammaproteobacteria bacterium]|nr:GNAT family N-acetyltransferase [Gammaproteobacteria bacterium]